MNGTAKLIATIDISRKMKEIEYNEKRKFIDNNINRQYR